MKRREFIKALASLPIVGGLFAVTSTPAATIGKLPKRIWNINLPGIMAKDDYQQLSRLSFNGVPVRHVDHIDSIADNLTEDALLSILGSVEFKVPQGQRFMQLRLNV